MAKFYADNQTGQFSGRIGNIVGMTNPRGRKKSFTPVRPHIIPKATEQNSIFAQQQANIKTLWSSATAGFKEDCKKYANRYNSAYADEYTGDTTSYGIFEKLVYNFSKHNNNNVSALTLEMLQGENITIATAVSGTNGTGEKLLPTISDAETLTQAI